MQGITDEDIFKLMDTFSIVDAACLIAGVSPNQAYYDDNWGEWGLRTDNKDPDNASHVFSIASNAIKNSIRANKLKATIVVENHNTAFLTNIDMSKSWLLTHAIDVKKTTIDRDDLIHWLKHKDVYPPVFFPQGRISDISNNEHKFYSPKLHAVVDAWESLFTADIQSTTVKKYLADWIKANKDKYGLDITSDQKFNELAEIVNFDKGGSTIVGNPLHHFGVEPPVNASSIKKQPINPQIYAKIKDITSNNFDDDLDF